MFKHHFPVFVVRRIAFPHTRGKVALLAPDEGVVSKNLFFHFNTTFISTCYVCTAKGSLPSLLGGGKGVTVGDG